MRPAARVQTLFAASLALLALEACSPPPHVDDGGMTCTTVSTNHCRDEGTGGSCGTTDVAPECQDGIWACPTGSVEMSSCACFNGVLGDCSDGGPNTDASIRMIDI